MSHLNEVRNKSFNLAVRFGVLVYISCHFFMATYLYNKIDIEIIISSFRNKNILALSAFFSVCSAIMSFVLIKRIYTQRHLRRKPVSSLRTVGEVPGDEHGRALGV